MDIFKLQIDPAFFRSTNAKWNELTLNDPWSVGYVTRLIQDFKFDSKEDWEKKYFESGSLRQIELEKLPIIDRELLEKDLLKKYDPLQMNNLPLSIKQLNWNYGRTKFDLEKKAILLKNAMHERDHNLEAYYQCVHHRVIGETWNGVIVREENTICNLRKKFPHLEFTKVDATRDYQYAIDYEVYKNNRLMAAIQIKPKTYVNNASYLIKAQKANAEKNKKYNEEYHVRVFTILSNHNGEIINPEVLETWH